MKCGHQIPQFRVYFSGGVHRPGDLCPDHFSEAFAQAMDRDLDCPFC